jgi:hypothetical protein
MIMTQTVKVWSTFDVGSWRGSNRMLSKSIAWLSSFEGVRPFLAFEGDDTEGFFGLGRCSRSFVFSTKPLAV